MAAAEQVSKKRRVDDVTKDPADKIVIQINSRECSKDLIIPDAGLVESPKVNYYKIPKLLDPKRYVVKIYDESVIGACEFLDKFLSKRKGIEINQQEVPDLSQMTDNTFMLIEVDGCEKTWVLVKYWKNTGSFIALDEIFDEDLFERDEDESDKDDGTDK